MSAERAVMKRGEDVEEKDGGRQMNLRPSKKQSSSKQESYLGTGG